MNSDKFALEEAKQKRKTLSKVLNKERKNFIGHCDELKLEVKKEVELQREQDRLNKQEDLNLKDGGSDKTKRLFMVADEEEAFSEQLMHRRILKLSFLNTIQRRHIKQHQKNIEVFEQAFATIKSSTGIHEIEEIVKIFKNIEQRNFSLLTYVNQLNREIESIEIQNRELQVQLKGYRQDQKDADERKNHSLKELTEQIKQTQAATAEKDAMIKDSAKALADCRPIIWEATRHLKEKVPDLVHQGYEGDVPPMKTAPPDQHEESIEKFLMYIEESLMQFRVCLSQESLKHRDMPQLKPPAGTNTGASLKRPGELPVYHEESDDDLEWPVVLTRNELRERAQQNVNKKQRKPARTPKMAGQTQHDPADDQSAECPPSRKAAEQPPPPRDYAASNASKDSKDESGGGTVGAQLSKSPSMSGKQQSDSDASGREGHWWRGKGAEK